MQTLGFSPPAPGKKLRLRQKISSSGKCEKIRNLKEISHFKVEALSLFFIFTSRYWLRKTTEYNIYTFVASLRSINASIYFFVYVFCFFRRCPTVVCSTNKCCRSFAGVEQTRPRHNRQKFRRIHMSTTPKSTA